MDIRKFLAVLAVPVIVLSGCQTGSRGGGGVPSGTRSLRFQQNVIPQQNGGQWFSAPSNTGGPVLIPVDINLTGVVRDQFDTSRGGVEYAYATYEIRNNSLQPMRVRMWIQTKAVGAPSVFDPATAQELNIHPSTVGDIPGYPANGDPNNGGALLLTDTTLKANVEPLRAAVERVLRHNERAVLFIEATSADATGVVQVRDFTINGVAYSPNYP